MQYSSDPLRAYLNINSLQNKGDTLRKITKDFPLDIFCVDETKLDDSFPDNHFKIDRCQFPPLRRDKNKVGGGKILYAKDGLIVKRINDFKAITSEAISLELTVSNKIWFMMFEYNLQLEIMSSHF